ncbi:hypothetical protein SAMN05443429_102312 [Cruoricaptor ignavus]|uniref:Uncharacterized protein n=1 Tax=Cruoricaptor ignavus TaxID=1118202 RepID=A0A1M6CDH6_9FLAO|nr:DUF2683 family protein [Cruoricaptor ignavus]SHI59105.1 hypothetical protein SAMN05443429_102312 [Cruoricaptor ignavus]
MQTVYHINIDKKDETFLEEFLNRMNIRFSKNGNETVVAEDSVEYSKEFAEKILQGEKEIREGKGVKMTLDELKEFLEL